MKISRLVFTIILGFTMLMALPLRAFADEGSVLGSSIVVPNYQLTIDGHLVASPTSTIASSTRTPIMFGYVQQSVYVHLRLDSKVIAIVSTDESGYWNYKPSEAITPGIHRLYTSISDAYGNKSATKLSATIQIPMADAHVLSVVPIPLASLSQLNYETVTMIVFLVVLTVAALYVFLKRLRRHEVLMNGEDRK